MQQLVDRSLTDLLLQPTCSHRRPAQLVVKKEERLVLQLPFDSKAGNIALAIVAEPFEEGEGPY